MGYGGWLRRAGTSVRGACVAAPIHTERNGHRDLLETPYIKLGKSCLPERLPGSSYSGRWGGI